MSEQDGKVRGPKLQVGAGEIVKGMGMKGRKLWIETVRIQQNDKTTEGPAQPP